MGRANTSKMARLAKLSAVSTQNIQDYGNPPEVQKSTKISATIDTGLLAFVDDYVEQHPGSTRSGVLDEALELWVSQMQKQSDAACYKSPSLTPAEKKARDDWSAITTEAAKHIWS